jgi:hypothetical protein
MTPAAAPPTLGQKQRLFARLAAVLIAHIYETGYECTLDWAYRPPEVAAMYAAQGKGAKASLHTSRLAVDLNLFKDGVYLSDTESHRPIGEWWEQQHPLCRWGGRFKDGNHYSFSHGGKA